MSDFTPVFRDDFSGSELDYGIWKAQYAGSYWNGMFAWDPSQLEVGDGKLTIATEDVGDYWLSGGLSTIPDGQTYGSYEFRARFDPGQGTGGVVLLWPSSNEWTDEVDIIETHDPQRGSFAFTNHGDPNVTEYVDVNVADWHTYRMDWTPGELTLFVDGQEKSRITTDVPDQPMSFGMQGHVFADFESWFGGAPDGSTPGRVEMEVDWVQVSAWTPGSGTLEVPAAGAPAEESWAGDWGGQQDWTGEDAWTAEETWAGQDEGAAQDDGFDWLAAAARYVENDGTWEGSWRNQVADGQITLEDVAERIQAGLGNPDYWQ